MGDDFGLSLLEGSDDVAKDVDFRLFDGRFVKAFDVLLCLSIHRNSMLLNKAFHKLLR